MGVLLALSTGAAGDTADFVKASGIALLWATVFLLASNLSPVARDQVLRFLVIIGLLQVVVMVFESVVPLAIVRDQIAATTDSPYIIRPNLILGDWTNRAQGTLGYPIAAGNYMALCFALCLSWLKVGPRSRVILLTSFGLAIVLTGTRTALIAIAVASVVALWNSTKLGFGGRFAATVAGCAALWAVDAFIGAAAEADDFSLTHRWSVAAGFFALLNRPLNIVLFGSGLNSHASVFEQGYLETSATGALDNAFIMTFVTSGLLSLLALVGLMIYTFYWSPGVLRPAFATFVVFFFSYDALWWHFTAVLFWTFVGVASGHRRRPSNAPTEESHRFGEVNASGA
ncbi:hypothetical protein [uncultured Microbacterium sp.]|uniref:hypothetical protein n=1 Tax=uncultured Microbacterium sp. TaxID=191216 RepID=UPI00260CA240|nr:hypothetical protein [uncultured Microbacterium sp.]